MISSPFIFGQTHGLPYYASHNLTGVLMERMTTADVKVVPRHIGLLNQCLQKAKRVALRSIVPVYADISTVMGGSATVRDGSEQRAEQSWPCALGNDLQGSLKDQQIIEALKLSLEGPPQHLSYVFRLLDDAGLKLGQ